MARDMSNAGDLADVNVPANAGKSREMEAGFNNDRKAQAQAAALLGYTLHGSKCMQCGSAESKGQLCSTGQELYRRWEEAQ